MKYILLVCTVVLNIAFVEKLRTTTFDFKNNRHLLTENKLIKIFKENDKF